MHEFVPTDAGLKETGVTTRLDLDDEPAVFVLDDAPMNHAAAFERDLVGEGA